MSNRVAILASQGDQFTAYKVLNLATAAASTEKEVAIFFTFEGLYLIHKEKMQQLPMPQGREDLAEGFAKAKIPSISQMIKMAQEMGVRLIGCQMSMDVMGMTKDDLLDGVEVGGAVTFLEYAKDAAPTITF